VAIVTRLPADGPAGEGDDGHAEPPPATRSSPRSSGSTGAQVAVGGFTASTEDFSRVVASKLPLFVGVVVLLSALLLLVVFRSAVIPVKAAVLNLLSIGAALGFVTLIFQDGHGAGLLGIGTGPIESFVPVLMFAIVFGLSMDYEVFLISRVHEEWEHTRDASGSVARGLQSTGRVITAAASIMIVVFAVLRARRRPHHQAVRHRPGQRRVLRRGDHPLPVWCRRSWRSSAAGAGGRRPGSTGGCRSWRSRHRRRIRPAPVTEPV
jgi:RND superfamily putative drug exporter